MNGSCPENQFFELLQIALGNCEGFSVAPSQEQWEWIVKLAKKQALLGVALDGIEKLPQEQRPERRFLLGWCGAVENIARRNERVNNALAELSKLIRKDGFRCILLKGQGVASLYSTPSRRICGDIDMWVIPPSEGSLAERRKAVLHYLRSRHYPLTVCYHHADIPPFHQIPVEIHFTPTWMNNPFRNRILQRYFERHARDVDWKENLGTDVPSAEVNALFILIHIYRHLFGEGIGLRQMLDYYHVLLQYRDRNPELQKIIRSLGLTGFSSAVSWILVHVFGMDVHHCIIPPNEKRGRFLLNEIMMAGNFGKFDPRLKRKGDMKNEWNLFKLHFSHSLHFLSTYPDEVLWAPLFKIWQYYMRKKKWVNIE